jgi:hypothetical protein
MGEKLMFQAQTSKVIATVVHVVLVIISNHSNFYLNFEGVSKVILNTYLTNYGQNAYFWTF